MSLVVNRDWEYIVTPWVRGLHFTSLAASGTDESGLNSARSRQATDPLTPLRRRDDSPSLSEFKESRKKLVPKRKRCRRRLNRSSAIRSESAVIHSTHGRLSDVGISSSTSLTDSLSPSPTPSASSPPSSLFLRVIVSGVTAIARDRRRKGMGQKMEKLRKRSPFCHSDWKEKERGRVVASP